MAAGLYDVGPFFSRRKDDFSGTRMERSTYLRRAALFVFGAAVVALVVTGSLLWQFERILIGRAQIELLERVARRAKALEAVSGLRPTNHPSDPATSASDLALAGIGRGMDLGRFGDTGRLSIAWPAGTGLGFRELAENRTGFGPLQVIPSLPVSPIGLGLDGATGVMPWQSPAGVAVMAAYAPIRGEGLALVGTVSLAELRAPFWRAAVLTLILSGLSIAALAVLHFALTSKLERRLDSQRRLFDTLLNALPYRVFVKDRERRYELVNTAFAKARKAEPDDFLGKRAEEIGYFDAQMAQIIRELDERTIREAKMVDRPEVHLPGPGGEDEVSRVMRVPVLDKQGRVVHIVGVMENITKLVHARQETQQTQRLLQALFDAVPHNMAVKDREGRFLTQNRALTEFYARNGLEGPMLTGKSSFSPAHFKNAEYAERMHRQVVATGRTLVEPDYAVELQSGRKHVFHYVQSPVLDEDGKVVAVASVATDITEQREQERALGESEERFRSVIAAMGEGLVLQSGEGRIMDVNAAAERLLGRGRKELLGQDLDGLLAEARQENGEPLGRGGRPVAEAIASGQARSVLLGVGAPGLEKWVVLNVVPLKTPGARDPSAAACTLLDVSERLRAERALARSEHRYRMLYANSPVGIYEMDADGNVLIVNDRLKAITSLDSERAAGKFWREAIHPDDRERMAKVAEEITKSERPGTTEFRFITGGGRTVWVEANAVALRDPGGRVTGYLGAITDLTRRKRAEVAQVQSYNLMSAVSRAQSKYIADTQFKDLFAHALQDLLLITGSTHGVIAEVEEPGPAAEDPTPAGTVAWRRMIREGPLLADEEQALLHPLRNLMMMARNTGERAVLDLPPATGEPPPGPCAFVALPLFYGKRMNALVGLAGRAEGYRDELFRFLQPLLYTYGAIIQAMRNDRLRKEAESAITQKNQQLESILANMAEGIVILDREGRVAQVNRLTRSMLEWGEIPDHKAEDLAGLFGFLQADGRPYPLADLAMVRALREGQTIIGQQVRLSRHWGDVALLVSASPLFGEGRTVSGVVAILSDVTELKRLDELKSDFISTVSHELRTPLAAILGYVELILEGDSGDITAEQRRYLEIVSRNTTRLTQLINDLLDIEKIETGKSKLNRAVVPLSSLLMEVESTFHIVAKQKGLRLVSRIFRDLSVVGDRDRLTQVFSNLLSNAVKYTREGEVRLEAERIRDEVRIAVADTGIGLSAENLGKLFTKFYRADDEYTRQAGGTGLGLVISRAIVAQHAGRIEVSSVVGKGTEFRVFLPSTLMIGAAEGGPAEGPPAAPEASGAEGDTAV